MRKLNTFIYIFLLFIIVIIVLFKIQLVTEPAPVYCLMVTGYNEDRLKYARTSILNFVKQTYKNKKLIIINQSKNKIINNLDKYPSILEVSVSNVNKSLGTLRNISLQFVPPNAYWTTWDDDDWRNEKYIQTMMDVLMKHKSNFLMFQNRIEYNILNKFTYKSTLKSGFMTFFAKQDDNLEYEDTSTSEDKVIKDYAIQNLNPYIYNNDAKMYIRLIHEDNTSVYVNNQKKTLKDTKNNKIYFESKLNQKELEYVSYTIKKNY
jgi:hypothetical protein